MADAPHLQPDPNNANRGTVRGLGMVERSLQQYGAGRSILASKDGIILAGNKTYDRAVELGIPIQEIESDGKTLFVIKRTDLAYDDPRAKELAIADNRTSETGLEWDAEVLTELADDGIDLSQFWFEDELADLLAAEEDTTEGLTDPDDVPDVPDEPITKPGDLWLLGRHRLLCGDSTNVTDVDRLMDGQKADLLMTDPPYGIDAPKMTLGTGKKEFYRSDWDGDTIPVSTFIGVADYSCIWGGNYYADVLPVTNHWLAWHKKNDGLSFSEFELAWTNYGKNTRWFSHHWSGEVKQHPTQKPVDVMAWAIELAPQSNSVIDLFGGSGSTLIACEQSNRIAYLMELDPHYCDVIVQRWEQFTGQTAQRAPEYSGVNT